MNLLTLLLMVVAGAVIFVLPVWMISDNIRGYYTPVLILGGYAVALAVGVLYWVPLAFMAIGIVWGFALLPIISRWFNR